MLRPPRRDFGSIAEARRRRLLVQASYTTVQVVLASTTSSRRPAFCCEANDSAMQEVIALTAFRARGKPGFPVGMTQLAEALVDLNNSGEFDYIPESKRTGQRALPLKPNLAARRHDQGDFSSGTWSLFSHLTTARAIESTRLNPGLHHWLGITFVNAGYLTGTPGAEIAVELSRITPMQTVTWGYVPLLLGADDVRSTSIHAAGPAGQPLRHPAPGQIAVLKGDLDLARQLLQQRDGFNAQEAERMRLFVNAREDPRHRGYLAFIDENPGFNWHRVLELTALGQFERALAFDLGGYPCHSWGDQWSEARGLPAFQQKIIKANLPEVWDALGPPPACRKVGSGYDCANGGSP